MCNLPREIIISAGPNTKLLCLSLSLSSSKEAPKRRAVFLIKKNHDRENSRWSQQLALLIKPRKDLSPMGLYTACMCIYVRGSKRNPPKLLMSHTRVSLTPYARHMGVRETACVCVCVLRTHSARESVPSRVYIYTPRHVHTDTHTTCRREGGERKSERRAADGGPASIRAPRGGPPRARTRVSFSSGRALGQSRLYPSRIYGLSGVRTQIALSRAFM